MLFLLIFLQLTFFFFSNVAALNITLQSNTIVGQPSLVLWSRQPSDGNGQLIFDLRFVNPDNKDIGLALANIQASPSSQYGTEQVVFQSPGSYLLVAVTGSGYTKIGQSGQVNAFQVPTTSISTSTATFKPSATTSANPSSTSATTLPKPASTSQRKKNLGAIIGGTLGGVAFLGLLAALGIIFLRRRRQTTEDKKSSRRWTFHRDKMILPPVLDIRRTTPLDAEFFSPYDIEQQRQQVVRSPPVVMMASSSPSGLRPSLKSPIRPLPMEPPLQPPMTRDSRQEEMMAQMEQIRNRITELEKNPGPTQRIILDDLQKQLNWLKSQI